MASSPQPGGSRPPTALGRSSRSILGGGVPQAPASLAPTVLLATSEPCCAAANKPQTMGQDCGGQRLCPPALSPTSRGKGEPRERTFLGGSSTCPALREHPQAAAPLAGHGFIPSKICHEANLHCLPADPARHVAAAAPSSEAGCSELQLPAALRRKGLSRTLCRLAPANMCLGFDGLLSRCAVTLRCWKTPRLHSGGSLSSP